MVKTSPGVEHPWPAILERADPEAVVATVALEL
jgi:hypothetical protein